MGNLSSITDQVALSRILTDVTASDLNNLSDDTKVATIVNLLQASLIQGIYPTSTQVISPFFIFTINLTINYL